VLTLDLKEESTAQERRANETVAPYYGDTGALPPPTSVRTTAKVLPQIAMTAANARSATR